MSNGTKSYSAALMVGVVVGAAVGVVIVLAVALS